MGLSPARCCLSAAVEALNWYFARGFSLRTALKVDFVDVLSFAKLFQPELFLIWMITTRPGWLGPILPRKYPFAPLRTTESATRCATETETVGSDVAPA